MFLNNSFPYSKSTRNHFLIALSISLITIFVIIFLHPFGAGDTDFPYKNIYFSGYGIVIFCTYFIILFISKIYYKRFKVWKWMEEIIFCLVFISLTILISFFYTEYIVNGNPSRVKFSSFIIWFKIIFLGFGIIWFIITILLRNYFGKEELRNINENIVIKKFDKTDKNSNKITIHSSLKKESLTIEQDTIVYVESEDNYIHIYFFEGDLLQQKMLRNTLKDIQNQLPFLLKTHRSFLVNPKYILQLKGNAQNAKLYLNSDKNTIPVSKTYYKNIKKYIN